MKIRRKQRIKLERGGETRTNRAKEIMSEVKIGAH